MATLYAPQSWNLCPLRTLGTHSIAGGQGWESGPEAHAWVSPSVQQRPLMEPPGVAPQSSPGPELMPQLWHLEGSGHRLENEGTGAGADQGIGAENCL